MKHWEPTPEILDKVKSLAARGLTQEQIAYCIGITQWTLCRKKTEYTQLEQAIKEGQALGISHVASFLFDSAKTGNVSAQIFYLKNRAGWSDNKAETNEIKDEISTMRETVQSWMQEKK